MQIDINRQNSHVHRFRSLIHELAIYFTGHGRSSHKLNPIGSLLLLLTIDYAADRFTTKILNRAWSIFVIFYDSRWFVSSTFMVHI